jgi:hypothetical protein
MAGTGNLILKRGSGIPSDVQNSGTLTLLKGMPAVQIVGLSRPSNLAASAIGEYAFDNYPNRLWIGFDGYGALGTSVGGVGGAGSESYNLSPTYDATKRPIWMGAEIRADAAVYRTDTSSALNYVPAVFRADWTNAVDTVLVTQKAIKTYVDAQVGGKGSMSYFNVSADFNGEDTSSIGNNTTLSILGSTGLTTQYNNTTLAINLDFAAISTVTPSSATGTYLVGTSGIANQRYTIGNVLAKMSGDVTASTSGITTVNSVTNLGTPSSGTLTNCTGLPATTGITGILSGANGGTGVVNTGKTITLGGNLTTAGAFTTTLTATASTSITLPTTGTLATLAGAEILTNKTIDTIAASGASAATVIHSAVTTGSITIGSGITTGSINIGNGTAITTNSAINIGGGAITSGTKAINIGTGAAAGTSTTSITIGGGNGTTGTICNVSIGCPSATTSNVYVANNKLTLGPSGSGDRIIITGDTTSSAGTRTHTFPNKASGNVVIVSGSETAGQVLIAGGGTTAATWGNAPATSSVKFSNETGNSAKYPIAFIATTSGNDPSTFSSLTEATETTGYLKTDWANSSVDGLYYNPGSVASTTAPFPQPNVSGGTLYAGFFSGVMDGGTWS